ncbi:MAG: type II secretion system F family protein [Acidimicrobiales bacterium]|nr:type II secretion system F family protein [Acidimicrobiales bacterium]
MLLPLFIVLLAGGLGVVVYTVLSDVEEKSVVRSSLRQLEGYEVENVRDQELLVPLRQRALVPLLQGLTGLGQRLTPVGYVDGVRQKFVYSGRPSADAVDRFLAVRVLTVAAIPLVFILAFFVLPLGGNMPLAIFGMGALALLLGPDAILNRRVEARQHTMQVQLPDILDLLVISVEAGLGFEQALDRTVKAVPGPLSDEFARMLGETRAGASRADAMRAMEGRTKVPEIRSFVLAIIQADSFGVSIGRVLRAQADEMRIKRRQLAQEKAQKAPVKMLIPMVFCIFPALFVVVIGPAAIRIRNNF